MQRCKKGIRTKSKIEKEEGEEIYKKVEEWE